MKRGARGRRRALLAAPLALLLAGCSTVGDVAPSGTDGSIVFGYIDMREAPSELGQVLMRRVGPASPPPYLFYVEDGVFFQLDVAPGAYKFIRFSGASFIKQTAYEYRFPAEGRGELDLQLGRPAVHFVGAWRYRDLGGAGVFKPGQFDIERVASPSEREVLEKVLAEARHEHWKAMIRARLAQLPR